MIGLNQDALICDLAETYGILDFKALPPLLLATLSCGLRADARIVRLLAEKTEKAASHQKDIASFESPAEYEKVRAALIGGD